MSVIGSNILAGASGQGGDYTIARSLRFRSSASAYLSRTPASASNRKTFTISFWAKRGESWSDHYVFESYSSDTNRSFIRFGSDKFIFAYDGSTNNLVTTQVFRDPSSWYHFVLAVDTTQGTASNRLKLYVNGSQVTTFDTANYPSQNTDYFINSNLVHNIGRSSFSGGYGYYTGYFTEWNFIDGQALTPSSFGATNASTGVWQPKKYAGTYGTNGFYLPFTGAGTASYAGSFNGSNQWLNGSLTSAIGSGDFTVEAWVYQNTLTNYQGWLSIERGAGGFNIGTDAAGSLTFYSSSAPQISVSGVIKAGTWQHIAFVRSGSTLTAYHNGISKGTATVTTNFSATAFYIGALNNIPQELANASISNLRITGTAVYTSNFTPPTQALTAISGTRLLTLQSSTIVDNSGNSISITNNGSVSTVVSNPFLGTNIASDQSGQGNNWTTNNISITAGSTYDSMTDVPTLTSATAANFSTFNPLNNFAGAFSANPTISQANLLASGVADTKQYYADSTIQVSSGKWYAEFTPSGVTGDSSYVGIVTDSYLALYAPTGNYYNNSSFASYGATYTTNDVIGVAYDADAGTITFYKNGTSQGQKTGITGSNAKFRTSSYNTGASHSWTANFGQRPFAYTPPTGFVALNTFNLPTPTIGATASTQANKYFDASLYTGTGSALTVTNSGGMQPDLVWIKSRNNATNNNLTDAIRGVDKLLFSNSTASEATFSGGLSSFNSNGFSLASGGDVGFSANGYTYVGWQWNAGGSTVTNTSGSISSQVRANTSAGFSVVTYTGNGTGGATVGHGIGVSPRMLIIKARNGSGYSWKVYHGSLGSGSHLELESTAAAQGGIWNSTNPSSTVFTLGTNAGINENGKSYVCYAFSEVAGYSRFGSYTGNGSTDGPFIFTGFRPKFLLVKRTDGGTNNWAIFDSSRNPNNATGKELQANLSDAEYNGDTSNPNDFLSNGFKIRHTGTAMNLSGGTYIYAAFAEVPTKFALAK